MRNLTLSLIALGACFLVFTNVQAQADVVCFPFEDLGSHSDNSSDEKIGEYMTGIMGSEVTIKNAQVKTNFSIFGVPVPWFGKAVGDYYLQTDEKKFMDITFETPITRVKGDGYVFLSDLRPDTTDFRVVGFYDDEKIGAFNAQVHIAGEVPFDLTFDSPVNRLRIRDNYKWLVGVDNLCVTPVPVPGAGLLSVIGIGVTGWLKRRKTL